MLIAIVLISIVYRIIMGAILTEGGRDYLGIDGVVYLQSAGYWFEGIPHEFDFIRSPLAPALWLWPFMWVLSDSWALIVWAGITSALPAIGAGMLARQWQLSNTRTYVVVAVVAFEPLSQHLWWAGAVVMLPTFLIMLALWGMQRQTTRGSVVAVCSMAFIPLCNIPLFVSCGLILGAYWLHNRTWRDFKVLLLGGLCGCVTFIPVLMLAAPLSNDYAFDILSFELLYEGRTTIETIVGLLQYSTTWWVYITFIIVSVLWAHRQIWPSLLICISCVGVIYVSTSEPIQNIPLRTLGAMLPLSYLAVARWGRIPWTIPAILLIVSSPLITLTFYNGSYSAILDLTSQAPEGSVIRMTGRAQIYLNELYNDDNVKSTDHNENAPAVFQDDYNEYLCMLGKLDISYCQPNQPEYWILNAYQPVPPGATPISAKLLVDLPVQLPIWAILYEVRRHD